MNNIAKKTNRNLIITTCVISVVFVGFLALGWYYIIDLSNKANSYSTEANNYKKESQMLEVLKVRMSKLAVEKELAYQLLPRTKDISGFISKFETQLKQYNLNMSSTSIGSTKSRVKMGSDYSQTVNKQQYYEIPIKYSISGSYLDFKNFVASLSTMERTLSVSDIVIVFDGKDPDKPSKVNIQFSINIYAKK